MTDPQSALDDRIAWLQTVTDSTQDVIYLKDRQGRYMQINRAGANVLGLPIEEICGRSDQELFPSQDACRIEREDQAVLRSGQPQEDETHLHFGDVVRTFSTSRMPYCCAGGEVVGVVGISRDISEVRAAQLQAEQASQHLTSILERITDAFYALDHEGRFQYVNAPAEQMLGRTRDALLGRSIWSVFPEGEFSSFAQALQATVTSGQPAEFDQYSPLSDRWFEVHIYPSADGVALFFSDVTARRQAEVALSLAHAELERRVQARTAELEAANERLRHNALHDALTGLPNRVLLLDRLGRVLERAGRHPETGFALILLDLDGFRWVNDTWGAEVSDQVLQEVAARLSSGLRSSDTLARLSGDVFVLLIEEDVSLRAVKSLGTRLRRVLQAPLTVAGQTLYMTAGVGLVLGRADHQQAQEVLLDADLAKRQAKAQGKGAQVAFSPALRTRSRSRQALEDELRSALKHQTLGVEYQPIVDLATGELRGVEALARWTHPEYGQVSPAEFIPLAESLGLIVALDRLVLGIACTAWQRWQRECPALRQLTLSVNISAQHVARPHLARDLEVLLANHRVPATCLQLEITESSLLHLTAPVRTELEKLRQLGIRLAIDDFGTGYSSLSYLQHLPVSTLKIDRSFVSGAAHQPGIVQAIVALAHTLGLAVVAEGVETQQQQAELAALGCKFGQGYLFSRPVSAEQLMSRLNADGEMAAGEAD
ncbi:EAL domain-containing protein [Deinococcus oregonensis]|uniref:EAL domain-containing protein n=1 Tax=Deinococcus oregonensis TaxID=1805970 RepID=A0ABV6ASP8_9DEIO